ncbi:cell division control protein 42 homolog [Mercenaria mercenaria]|uniref:cell division control protein 42 homolog n=1 Tax=Mercenaria mercenaria TaxID=6596 RepID=UPI001E1DF9AB|nr:cell division control protein 42 homolog [Mercenaria mercenaria]XP_045158587.1 cell division control protein 42 homolog [Mercenaria mercenaria]
MNDVLNSTMAEVHIVVVGDNNVGKTSLCITFSTGQFPSLFTPMECNRVPHEKDMTVGTETVHVKCTDTEGHEDYDDTRPESYSDADIFLLCFSVSGPSSFQNIKTKWIPELKRHAPKVPILLVGCKEDTRHGKESSKDVIKKGQGKKMKKAIKALSYVECSALKKNCVNECFLEAVKVAKGQSDSGGTCGCIML